MIAQKFKKSTSKVVFLFFCALIVDFSTVDDTISLTRKGIMHSRLKIIRKTLGLTQAEVAKQLALDRSYYSQLETGKSPLVSRWVNLITKLYNVNREWFETGEGEMFLTPTPSPPPAFDLDATVDEFVAVVAKLPREMQELIAKIGLSICDKLDLSPLGACADGTTDKGNSQQN